MINEVILYFENKNSGQQDSRGRVREVSRGESKVIQKGTFLNHLIHDRC